MWNRGEGSYLSGVHSIQSFSAVDGLGVEVALSSPINRIQWQDVRAAIAPVDSAVLAAWDHMTEYPPGSPTSGGKVGCSVIYPAVADVRLIVFSVVDPTRRALEGGLDSGEWWNLTLQLFPDGTCGVAVNGNPIARSTVRFPLDKPQYVFLDGSSKGTKMLHGPVRVWQGVRGDIDWRVLHEER